MSQVLGKNVILYTQAEDTAISVDVVDNGDGTQTVTVTWGEKPANTTLTRIGYNDGSWHDSVVLGTSSGSITIPTGSYTYRVSFLTSTPGFHVYIVPTTFTTRKPFACGRNITITRTTDFIETSVSGSGINRTVKPTANSWAASFEGIVAFEEEGMLTIADLLAKQANQEILDVEVETTDDEGNILYVERGSGYLGSVSYNGSYNDMATFNGEIRGNGELIASES